jgi:hypothetical protein|tara:strand:+ start:28213 stop:28434 length:222 start_codon:yes stop_codon:yes gene_type:complete
LKFEYKVLNISDFIKIDDSSHELRIEEGNKINQDKEHSDITQNKLNELGQNGWELISITSQRLFFKRSNQDSV